MKSAVIVTLSVLSVMAVVAVVCLVYFLGIPKCVGNQQYNYTITEKHICFEDIDLFGKTIVPNKEGKLPTVIYVHGAESKYDADLSTLVSLAKSGIACYTFDIYGWSKRSTGPNGDGDYFKGTARGVDDAYERQVELQAHYLDEVISQVKTFDFVDADNLFLLGSSMGGATVCVSATRHSSDIKGIVLQYPAINLVPSAMTNGGEYDINKFAGDVLILQGKKDTIVPYELSESLHNYLNTLRKTHSQIVYFENEKHVFIGKYKVISAEYIYNFIVEMDNCNIQY